MTAVLRALEKRPESSILRAWASSLQTGHRALPGTQTSVGTSDNQESIQAARHRPHLSRHWADRLLYLPLVPLLAALAAGLLVGVDRWRPANLAEAVGKFLIWDAALIACLFVALMGVWLLFAPRWLESWFRWCGDRLVRSLLVAAAVTFILLAYYVWGA